MGSIIQLVGTTTGGTENGIASFDIPVNTVIEGVEWSCRGDLDADGEFAQAELSFGSAFSLSSDSRQVVSHCYLGQQSQVTAASVANAGYSYYSKLPDVPVAAGERMFMHSNCSAGVIAVFVCMIHLASDEPRPGARRR